jgi:hypothetical protein
MARKRIRGWAASALRADQLLIFWETDEFRDDWEELGFSVENDLLNLQLEIMGDPEAFPVVRRTGRLRKMRFASADANSGKSGAARVCYAYFKKYGVVLLVMAYGKNEKDTLTREEESGVKTYLEAIEVYLEKRSKK